MLELILTLNKCRCSFFCVETGTCRLLLVHIMTLKVPMSTRHPCPLLKMWRLAKESLFLQIHHSQRPGEYKTQVSTMSLRSCVYTVWVASAKCTTENVSCSIMVLPLHWVVTALTSVYYRCRVVATWGQSQIHWWGSVWACKHSYG